MPESYASSDWFLGLLSVAFVSDFNIIKCSDLLEFDSYKKSEDWLPESYASSDWFLRLLSVAFVLDFNIIKCSDLLEFDSYKKSE